MQNENYWKLIETMINENGIIIDRPKGSHHPRYPNYIYPLDYGYIANTNSGDMSGIDIWIGSLKDNKVNGVICTIDSLKLDSEIKILYNCMESEINLIYEDTNRECEMQGIIILRREET